jgi:Asp-tRNA(Asn)/Glu-tRNA(Gln) amidotransferase A subunit family amidase
VTKDIDYLSAIEAVRLFRSRKLSPVELMQAVIDRAAEVEPAINAFAQTFYDEALVQARASEARYSAGGAPPRPLEGLPVAVKEEAPIAGHKNTLGSLALRDFVADHTAPFVQRVAAAHEQRFPWFDAPERRPVF